MRAVKEIQIELSLLRRLLADTPQNMYRTDGTVEGLSTRGPEFLGPGAVSSNAARCFVIMPYSERWSADVERIILEVCSDVGLEFTIAKSMEGRFVPHDIWTG